MSAMVAIPAISPASGGKGEGARADFLESLLKSWGFSTMRYEYSDQTGTKRPNIVATYGTGTRTWFIVHMDTVAEGDRSLWKTDPFKAHIEDGKIFGRGTNDNGQDLVAAMYALRALKSSGISASVGLALVADEELGSEYGIQKLIEEKNIFMPGDLFVVPDFLSTNGLKIEVAEKGALWIKVTVTGKQVHASTPALGVNANRYASMLITEIDGMLHSKYSEEDMMYSPSTSTFEPTKREKNVDSINIIPGTDIFYFDCRVLPKYKLDDVLNDIKAVASSEKFKSVSIGFEIANREDPAPPTDMDSEVVKKLKATVKRLCGVEPKPIGIGGGTCAAFFRRKGYAAASWGTERESIAHQPNEYTSIDDMVADAKVFAAMCV